MRGKLVVGNWKMNGGLRAKRRAAGRTCASAGRRSADARADRGVRSIPVSRAGAGRAVGLDDRLGRAGRERARARRAYRRGRGGDARGVRVPLRARRAFGAAAVARRDRRAGGGEGEGGAGGGTHADRVRRRDARRARSRRRPRRWCCVSSTPWSARLGSGSATDRGGVRAGVGDRHGRTATPEQAQEVHALLRGAPRAHGRGRGRIRCCTAAASRRATPRRCSRARTSTAGW